VNSIVYVEKTGNTVLYGVTYPDGSIWDRSINCDNPVEAKEVFDRLMTNWLKDKE
jgi:hypothetical protein